jgi:uncharacterized protein YbjT (DUF2867 family)
MLDELQTNADPVHVINAARPIAADVCRALIARGVSVVAVVSHITPWRALGIAAEARVVDFADHFSLSLALKDAIRIVSGGPPRIAKALLGASPDDALHVLLGSASRHSGWPDDDGLAAMEAERVLFGSGRNGVILHPTLTYGLGPNDPLHRLAGLMRRFPIWPLPNGGQALTQPIHHSDVTRSLLAALDQAWPEPESLVLAGPSPMPRHALLAAIAQAAHIRAPRILALPPGLLAALADFFPHLPPLPPVTADDIRRAAENQAFDIMPMFNRLGVVPRPLSQGLASAFAGE